MESSELLLVLFMVIQASSVIGGLPKVNGTESQSDTAYVAADQFLTSYGYYPSIGLHPLQKGNPSLRTHSITERATALKLFQEFYNLPQSGKLDKETTQLMQRPRCGNPDITSNLTNVGTPAGFRVERDVSQTRKEIEDPGKEESNANFHRRRRAVDLSRKRRVKRHRATGLRWRRAKITWLITHPSKQLPVLDQRRIMHKAMSIWEPILPFKVVEETLLPIVHINIMFYSFATSSIDDEYIRKFWPWKDVEEGETDLDRAKKGIKTIDLPDIFDTKRKGNSHAFAMPPSDDPYGHSGDIHFDDDYDWTNATELLSVALHQIGHAVGLDHSQKETAVMYPVNNLVTSLSLDDTQGIGTIYYGPNWRFTTPLRSFLCNFMFDDFDFVFKETNSPDGAEYMVISGDAFLFVDKLAKRPWPDDKKINYWWPIAGIFWELVAPPDFDLAFTVPRNKSLFFLAGNILWHQMEGNMLTPINVSLEAFPERPKFAWTIDWPNESYITVLAGYKYYWRFKMDGQTVVKPQMVFAFSARVQKLMAFGKYAVQWKYGLVYIITRDDRYFTLDFPTGNASTVRRGKPKWMTVYFCDYGSLISRVISGSERQPTRISRPSLVVIIILSLIKFYCNAL